MADLKARLRAADSMKFRDGIWDEVVRRSDAALPGEPVAHEPQHSNGRRAGVTAIVALVVAAAGFGGAVIALLGGEPPQSTQTASEGRIVFAAPGESTWQLFSANPDGTDVAQVTQIEPAFVVQDPAWSADGTHLAYVVREADTDRGIIWVSDADGSNARPITGDMHAIDPSWSPDGSQVAFTRVDGADATQIWIADIASRRARPFTHCTPPECLADSSPAWSPDGRSLAFVRQAGAGAVVAASIYVWPTNEGTVENIGYASIERADHVGDLTWSPDGSRIGMTIATADRSAIYVVDSSPDAPMFEGDDYPRGVPERLPLLEDLHASSPTWSPDGSRIAFVVSTEGHDRLYVANADGTEAHPIPALPGSVSSPSWQPVVAPRLDGDTTTPTPVEDITDATIGHRIDVGQSSALLYAEGSVWVVTGPDPSTLIRIDGATGEVQARIPVDVFPDAVHGGGGIAYDGTAVWLVGTSWTTDGPRSGILVRVDTSTNEAETHDLPVTIAGSQLVFDGGFLWTTGVSAPGKDPRVLQIDPSTTTVVSETPIDAEWWGDSSPSTARCGSCRCRSATQASKVMPSSCAWMSARETSSRQSRSSTTRAPCRASRRSRAAARSGPPPVASCSHWTPRREASSQRSTP
jgi:Tol biopolymer transport system component